MSDRLLTDEEIDIIDDLNCAPSVDFLDKLIESQDKKTAMLVAISILEYLVNQGILTESDTNYACIAETYGV